jgi:hypothetical protein
MKKFVSFIFFLYFILLNHILINNENKIQFEFYWKQSGKENLIYFAALSELKNLALTEEDFKLYTQFTEKCMDGHDNVMLLYLKGKKTAYACSKDPKYLTDMIAQEKAEYKKRLKDLAEAIKSGMAIEIFNASEKGASATMKAEVCPEWDRKDSLLLGYAIKNLAQANKNGIFSVEGCSVKIVHFDQQGNVDRSKD